ncbi:MAG: hypothetical protein R2747_00050 [Pyrinomonadaceae bacterium]
MKNTTAKIFIVLTLIAIFTFSATAQVSDDFLITGGAVGRVRLGMTVGEARKIWRDYQFERTRDGEFSALIAVKRGNRQLVTIKADEKGYLNEDSPIQNDAPIEFMEVWDKSFKTAEGVSPGMTLRAAEGIYGKVKRIELSQIELREYAEFAGQPEGLDFRLSSREDYAGVNYRATGRGEETGERITREYVPSAYIFNITISRPPLSKDPETAENTLDGTTFTSVYTDLRTDCRETESVEGGHVSNFCQGPGNFQIHYFDSATTYSFYVETLDRQISIPLTGMGMDKLKDVGRIEWRLADGRPFAVIMSLSGGRMIIAKGLPGFGRIDSREEGKGAIYRTRDLADNDYLDAVVPATRLVMPAASTELMTREFIKGVHDKVKYVIRAEAGYRMTVTIMDTETDSEEGAIMIGSVLSPDGETDGNAGGLVFDSVLGETGDYEILISQNAAKSQAENIRFRVRITLEPAKK